MRLGHFRSFLLGALLVLCRPAWATGSPQSQVPFTVSPHQLKVPLEERILLPNNDLLTFITQDNAAQGLAAIARPCAGSTLQVFFDESRKTLSLLPARVRKLLESRLQAIIPVSGLGSAGYTAILDATLRPERRTAFVALDCERLSGSLESWFFGREAAPFRASQEWKVTGTLAPHGETAAAALRYALVHELGHVLSVHSPLLPDWETPQAELASRKNPFFELSWHVTRSQNLRKKELPLALATPLLFFQEPRLNPADLSQVFQWLSHSDFVSLYAASSPFEDFAESFAAFIHIYHFKHPLKHRVFKNGSQVMSFENCFSEGRCAEKKALLEALIEAR